MKILAFLMAFMLVLSFTTAVIGSPVPSLDFALKKISEINLDVSDIWETLSFISSDVADHPSVQKHPGMVWYEELWVDVQNFFIDLMAEITGIILFVNALIETGLCLLEALFDFLEVGVYLLFGIDVDYSSPAEGVL